MATGFLVVPGEGLAWSAASGMMIATARVQPVAISSGLCQMAAGLKGSSTSAHLKTLAAVGS